MQKQKKSSIQVLSILLTILVVVSYFTIIFITIAGHFDVEFGTYLEYGEASDIEVMLNHIILIPIAILENILLIVDVFAPVYCIVMVIFAIKTLTKKPVYDPIINAQIVKDKKYAILGLIMSFFGFFLPIVLLFAAFSFG